jgi:hypothetical protein
MGKLTFAESAWEEYIYWQENDKKTLKRVNLLRVANPSCFGYNSCTAAYAARPWRSARTDAADCM